MISEGNTDLRYTLCWGVLAIFGVLAWLFGDTARISEETLDTAIWGVSFGLILGAPLLAFGGETLRTAVGQLFNQMSIGTVLAYLVFVMPLAETLFFRGILQQSRPFWAVGLMGTVWSVVLLVPLMNLREYPVVAFIIVLTLLMMNMMYSYVRQRNGLAAAWICQIVVNLVLVFLPFIGR
jgi:membrane protease YdiL (CAAX protease family)